MAGRKPSTDEDTSGNSASSPPAKSTAAKKKAAPRAASPTTRRRTTAASTGLSGLATGAVPTIAAPAARHPQAVPTVGADATADYEEPSSQRSTLLAVGSSDIPGVPAQYDDGTSWLLNGLRRHRLAAFVALLAGWSGVWLALWGAVFGMFVGVLVAVGASSSTSAISNYVGAGEAVTVVSIMAGLALGAVGGFVAAIVLVFSNPISLAVSVGAGLIITWCVIVGDASFERISLRVRGYRRLSRDEVRRVAPLVKAVADAMDLPALPRFAMDDNAIPNAWTHMRTVVITSGLLATLDDGELQAILAHELGHWREGDCVGLRFIWAASLPVALVFNLGMLIAGRSVGSGGEGMAGKSNRNLLTVIGWAIAWPAYILIRLVIAPLTATSQRRYEYEADAAAAEIGLAGALSSALSKIGAFEGGRTGWEQAMTATHPPTELRLEALQPPRPDDDQYSEEEFSPPSRGEVMKLLRFWV